MSSIKKIGVVTSTRAEYGLFFPLLKEFDANEDYELILFVTGTHLSYEFGFTKNQIIEDGFKISEEIDCVISNDTPVAIGKTSGLVLMGLCEAFYRQKPDIVFLLGDRYETLCAAIAAIICHIPIAHLHGGEITEGAYDDGFRHAITKLSHLHFTSTEEYRKRVIQMGENPDNVFNVGALGIDNIKNIKPLSKKELESNLNIKFKDKNLLLTIHPETLTPGSSEKNVDIVIDCLKKLKGTFVIITGTNADSEGRIINQKLKDFASNCEYCFFINSLGLLRYISILHIVDVVVGNSSSGIIEVPSFGIPTINIGDRQKGRMRANSVFDVNWNEKEIFKSIESNLDFKSDKNKIDNPYGDGRTTKTILEKISEIGFTNKIKSKHFYDKTE